MTPEQIERTIEFIIEHQAQAAVHLEAVTAGLRTGQAQTRDVQGAVLILSELAKIQSRLLDSQSEEF